MSTHSDTRKQSRQRRAFLGPSGTDFGRPLPIHANLDGSLEFDTTIPTSSGPRLSWRRYERYETDRREMVPEQESVHREHIRSSHWQPQPLRLPRKQQTDDVRQREAEYRRMAACGNTGERESDFGARSKKHPRESPEGEFGNRSAFRGGTRASSPGDEQDDTAAHVAVQHLERLYAEIQHLDAQKSVSQAGEAISDGDTSQCVYYHPRDDRYKRTAQPGLLPLPETPEAKAERHHAMAERVCRLLTETDFRLSALSIVSDTTSGSGPGAKRQSEPHTSAAVVRTPELSLAQDVIPRPRAHRQDVPPPESTQRGVQARHRTPQPRQEEHQQPPPQPSYRPPPKPKTHKAPPTGAAKPQKIPTKTAFSKRANKKAGWKVTLPPGHSTRPPGLFNPSDQMLERQRCARLAHALHGCHHTGGTPPLRGEWYRQELASVAGEAARAQDGADRTAAPPTAGRGKYAGAQRDNQRRRRVRIQEPGGRPVDAAAATPPRKPCAGCHQTKRRAKKLIRKYGFCFRCLRTHLVNLGELRSCAECRELRVKEDYFLYDKSGAKQNETRVCTFCRWRKKGKCEFLCGRRD